MTLISVFCCFSEFMFFFLPSVKKGYHKVSLKVHPDRVSAKDKEEATKKFQILGRVYSILSDENKRGVYDETGWYVFALENAQYKMIWLISCKLIIKLNLLESHI